MGFKFDTIKASIDPGNRNLFAISFDENLYDIARLIVIKEMYCCALDIFFKGDGSNPLQNIANGEMRNRRRSPVFKYDPDDPIGRVEIKTRIGHQKKEAICIYQQEGEDAV